MPSGRQAAENPERFHFSYPGRCVHGPVQRDHQHLAVVCGSGRTRREGQFLVSAEALPDHPEGIERSISLLIDQVQERHLEEEQLAVGWRNG